LTHRSTQRWRRCGPNSQRELNSLELADFFSFTVIAYNSCYRWFDAPIYWRVWMVLRLCKKKSWSKVKNLNPVVRDHFPTFETIPHIPLFSVQGQNYLQRPAFFLREEIGWKWV
jgi:hypothetical protein